MIQSYRSTVQYTLVGEEMWVNLQLQLLSDLGLIGLANAGKSTFLATSILFSLMTLFCKIQSFSSRLYVTFNDDLL